jgi:hypothetical protein
VKNNLTELANFICIDKRKVDPNTGQITILLENGTTVSLPPNIHSVPAVMLVKDNYRVIYGNDIMGQYGNQIKTQMNEATLGEGEPSGFSFHSAGTDNVMSEKFTLFHATPQDLSAKGVGGNRQLYHYVSANVDVLPIKTPPDTYKPNKLAKSITIDSLQQQRNEDISNTTGSVASFIPQKI